MEGDVCATGCAGRDTPVPVLAALPRAGQANTTHRHGCTNLLSLAVAVRLRRPWQLVPPASRIPLEWAISPQPSITARAFPRTRCLPLAPPRHSYKAFDVQETVEVAMHIIRDGASVNEEKLARFCSMKHDNLMSVLATWNSPGGARLLITDTIDSGTLEGYLARVPEAVRWKVGRKWCLHVLDALDYLHTQKPEPMSHGLVIPGNIFLSKDHGVRLGPVCVIDLGASNPFSEKCRHGVYQAPEGPGSPAADIYSFGLCFLQLLTRQQPYWVSPDETPETLTRAKLSGAMPALLNPAHENAVDEEFAACIRRCLAHDPADRPTAEELIAAPAFTKRARSHRAGTDGTASAASAGKDQDDDTTGASTGGSPVQRARSGNAGATAQQPSSSTTGTAAPSEAHANDRPPLIHHASAAAEAQKSAMRSVRSDGALSTRTAVSEHPGDSSGEEARPEPLRHPAADPARADVAGAPHGQIPALVTSQDPPTMPDMVRSTRQHSADTATEPPVPDSRASMHEAQTPQATLARLWGITLDSITFRRGKMIVQISLFYPSSVDSSRICYRTIRMTVDRNDPLDTPDRIAEQMVQSGLIHPDDHGAMTQWLDASIGVVSQLPAAYTRVMLPDTMQLPEFTAAVYEQRYARKFTAPLSSTRHRKTARAPTATQREPSNAAPDSNSSAVPESTAQSASMPSVSVGHTRPPIPSSSSTVQPSVITSEPGAGGQSTKSARPRAESEGAGLRASPDSTNTAPSVIDHTLPA